MTRDESPAPEREVRTVDDAWQVWDRRLERDVTAGKLDEFAAEALAEHERGETTEL